MRLLAATVVLALGLAGCQAGQDPGVETANGNLPLPRTDITIVARNTAFDPQRVAAPVGEQLTITFENEDATGHNLHLFGGTAGDFRTEITPGPASETIVVTFNVAASYQYRCDVHPDRMNGEIVVVS